MRDKPYVRPVDPHAERHCGDDDVGTLGEECFLAAAAIRIGEAGVIGQRRKAAPGQPRRQSVDFSSRRTVDDAGLAAR